MAKGFKFKLERIMNLKIEEEEEEKKKLVAIRKKLKEAQDHLQYLKDFCIQMEAQLREKQKGTVKIHEIQLLHNHIRKVKEQDIPQQMILIQQIQIEEQEQFNKYMEARIEVKKFEKLKEKARKEYEEKELQEEAKLIDEIATIAAARKMQ